MHERKRSRARGARHSWPCQKLAKQQLDAIVPRATQRSVGMALARRLREGAQMKMKSIVRPAAAGAIAIAAMSVVAIPEALAQEPSVQSGPVQAVTGSVQQIILTMGKGELFKTSAPFTKLSVADDKIVEVTPQSDREFIFNPKGIERFVLHPRRICLL